MNATIPQERLFSALRLAKARSERITRLIAAELGSDASQWQRTCPECRVETVRIDLTETTLASHEDLRVHWEPCVECRARSILASSGVPAILTPATLDNWTAETEEAHRVLAKVREFAARPIGFLMLVGPEFGVGKSHLAVAVLRVQMFRQHRVRFVTAGQFLRSVRRRYDDHKAEDAVEMASTIPFLALDDFGVSVGGKDEAPTIHDVFNARIGNRLPTILTMNLAPDEFREAIGPRMASRLREATFAWVTVRGTSHRAGRRAEYLRK